MHECSPNRIFIVRTNKKFKKVLDPFEEISRMRSTSSGQPKELF
jgi:hypothetical protein